MKLQQGFYLIRESFHTLGRHKGIMFLSIIIMSLTLLVLAVFLLATDNMMGVLAHARNEMKVYVYLDDATTQDDIEKIYTTLLSMDAVESLIFISKDQAMAEFKEELGEEQTILESLEANPLPASFQVILKANRRDQTSTEEFARAAGALDGVEEVNYGRDFLERFTLITRIFLYVDIVLGAIVILSSIFIIANTVRLTILSRRKSIEILKLVGATNRFITTPFIIEGAMQGLVASVVSLGLLALIYTVSRKLVPGVGFLAADEMAMYVATCILLGSLGSYAALRRFLRL